MNRRSLLLGLGAALAAPAIVKAENIMKVARLRSDVSQPFIPLEIFYDTSADDLIILNRDKINSSNFDGVIFPPNGRMEMREFMEHADRGKWRLKLRGVSAPPELFI